MNKVILMGRLTRDPEVRYSQGERAMAIARYTLAVDRRGRRGGNGGRKEGIILRQLTFAANLATINKVSVREWRNGRRAGFRHQFQRSEGSTPFSRIKNDPKLRLEVIFYLAEKRGRTARPPDGSYHDMDK